MFIFDPLSVSGFRCPVPVGDRRCVFPIHTPVVGAGDPLRRGMDGSSWLWNHRAADTQNRCVRLFVGLTPWGAAPVCLIGFAAGVGRGRWGGGQGAHVKPMVGFLCCHEKCYWS